MVIVVILNPEICSEHLHKFIWNRFQDVVYNCWS